jgi:dihydrofolate reductase
LIAALNGLGLIDEFHVIVHPTLLCRGKPILSAMERPAQLELIECRPFSTGAVLLRYAVSTSTLMSYQEEFVR